MISRARVLVAAVLGFVAGAGTPAPGLAETELFAGKPHAVVDLATPNGAALVQGEWRYSDTRIVETQFTGPGADGQPSGDPVLTYDYRPKAGGADFDDRDWSVIAPESLRRPRGPGHVAFNWYRIRFTVPARIADFDPTGATVVFETKVDDYAEIWVDGELPHPAGLSGGSVVKGWNAPNRLVVGRDVHPGQQIQLAVFGINGPISKSPTNYIFMHYARLEFHRGDRGPRAVVPHEVNVEVERLDPALDAIVPLNPKVWKLAEGFKFTEGPVWVPSPNPGGYLLFSDPNANAIYKYSAHGDLSVFRSPSGYAGADIAEYGQPGSNGLTIDRQGRLTFDEHGNHRVSRIEHDGTVTVLADRYHGKRLNSPNDLVIKSDGAVYFTDPPFGLPKFFDDPRKELAYSGIYRWNNGELTLLSDELSGPNGIAFSPDEKFLYVGNWDDRNKVVMRYPVLADGRVGRGEVFLRHDRGAGRGCDRRHQGRRRGKPVCVRSWRIVGALRPRQASRHHPHRETRAQHGLGRRRRKTLYLTAQDRLYRMRLNIAGVRPN